MECIHLMCSTCTVGVVVSLAILVGSSAAHVRCSKMHGSIKGTTCFIHSIFRTTVPHFLPLNTALSFLRLVK